MLLQRGVFCGGLLVLVALGGPTAAAGGASISGPASVVDGDTLRIGAVSIRIHGIDAPEHGQNCNLPNGRQWACGQSATNHMARLTAKKQVECRPVETDRYGRIVAKCTAGGVDLAQDMVLNGLAWAYQQYSRDYVRVEASARSERRGVWQAQTMPAWDYRKAGWDSASANNASDTCPIKGNISRSGERIYHMPWSPAYARTRIDTSQGERWFCTEAEAVAAGWRAARWK